MGRFKKGDPRPKAAGRKKGTPNKATVAVKDALNTAFVELGGVPALVEFGRANPAAFYAMWVKQLPKELTGPDGGDIGHTVTVVVKRDRNFFGRGPAPRAAAAPDPDSGVAGEV